MYNPLRRWKIMGRYRHLRRARWPMHKLAIGYLARAFFTFLVCSPIYLIFMLFHLVGYLAEMVVTVLEPLPSRMFEALGGFEIDDRFERFRRKEARWKKRVLKLKS